MARAVFDRDAASTRLTEHDRSLDLEDVAERAQVVGPLRNDPGGCGAGITPAAASQVDQGRLLAHDRAVGDELRAFDVEEEPHAVHFDSHDPMNSRMTSNTRGSSR